jgi:hypothetical protein
VLEIAGQEIRKTPRQRDRLGVHGPAEHEVRHPLELRAHRCTDVGVVVAVTRGPPGRDPVDQHASVGEGDAYTVGPIDDERLWRSLHLAVWQPQRGMRHGSLERDDCAPYYDIRRSRGTSAVSSLGYTESGIG